MANTITTLVPTIYTALDKVSRELVGLIPAVNRDGKAERAAVGETVEFPVPPSYTAGDVTPSNTFPNPSDSTIGYGSLQITKSRQVQFHWSGEEVKGLENGVGVDEVLQGQLAQAMRTLVLEIEVALAALVNGASRAYAVSSGHTFDSTDIISSIAKVRQILSDNGAPVNGDMSLVLDTSFAAALRQLSVLYKANEAGSDQLLRESLLGRLHGFNIRESAGPSSLTMYSGTPSGLVINGAGNIAKGSVALTLKTGTGSFKKNDVVTIGTDTTKLYVCSQDGDATHLYINPPGLVAATSDGAAVAKVGSLTSYIPLLAFSRNAITLVTRAPALPVGGDGGEHTIVQDPVTGLPFDVALYRAYRKNIFEVAIAYGMVVSKNEHLALIMGT